MQVLDDPKCNAKDTALYSNFKYYVHGTPKYATLIERFINVEKVVGRVGSWKRQIFLDVARGLEDTNEREKGYRLFLALKVLKQTDDIGKAGIFLRAMKELSLEETIFWVWQYHSYKETAIAAFKCIHLNSRRY